MTISQAEKAATFRELHQGPGAFVIANPWDAARRASWPAWATRRWRPRAGPGRHPWPARWQSDARGGAGPGARHRGGNRPAGLGRSGEGLRRRARGGCGDHPPCRRGRAGRRLDRGCDRRPDRPLYDIAQATERVAAAVEAARALPFPFTLTARAENFLRGNPDLDDMIARLQAFEQAGADVLMRTGLARSRRGSRGLLGACPSRSISWSESRASRSRWPSSRRPACSESASPRRFVSAMSGLVEAAREVKDKGTFGYLDRSMPTPISTTSCRNRPRRGRARGRPRAAPRAPSPPGRPDRRPRPAIPCAPARGARGSRRSPAPSGTPSPTSADSASWRLASIVSGTASVTPSV